MANLTDIVRDIISLIDLNIPVESTDGVRVNVCFTLHITVNDIVEDGLGNQYLVTDFLNDTWVDVTPFGATVDPFAGEVLVAPPITFLHGSPSSVNNEYLQIDQQTSEKTPFIWLLESYEYEHKGRESSIEAAFDARLFFMDWADEELWINDQHNDLVIKPMENLANAFRAVIDASYSFKTIDSYNVRVRPRFGVEITNRGSNEKIINEDLSGVEMNVTLELYDTVICEC